MATISAVNLKVLALEPDKYRLLELQGYLQGWSQTIARDVEGLVKNLNNSDHKPHVILLYDCSVPPQGGLTDVFRLATGLKAHLPEEMPGVVALKILKDEESYFRDVPVIVYGTFEEEPFISCGADAVITSQESDPNALRKAIARVLKFDDIEQVPHSFREKKAIIIPEAEETPDPPDLTDDQLERLPLHLMCVREMLLRPFFVTSALLDKNVRKHIDGSGLHSELKRRGEKEIAEVAAKLLQKMSSVVEDAPFKSKKEAMDLVAKIIVEGGEKPGWTVHLLLLKSAAEAMMHARHNLVRADINTEFSPKKLRAFRVNLKTRIGFLDNTDTLEIAESYRALRAVGDPEITDICTEAHDMLENIPDEKTLAREAAAILKAFASLDTTRSATTTYEFERSLETLLPSARPETQQIVRACVKQVIEEIYLRLIVPGQPCTAPQFSRLVDFIEDRLHDPLMGPRTEALLFEVVEQIEPDMTKDEMLSMVKTLAQFKRFGGSDGVPEHNALREVSRAFDRAIMPPRTYLPKPSDQPRPAA